MKIILVVTWISYFWIEGLYLPYDILMFWHDPIFYYNISNKELIAKTLSTLFQTMSCKNNHKKWFSYFTLGSCTNPSLHMNILVGSAILALIQISETVSIWNKFLVPWNNCKWWHRGRILCFRTVWNIIVFRLCWNKRFSSKSNIWCWGILNELPQYSLLYVK